MKKMNKKGFTIVELVIVIAVIAILAGVMIPTFSSIVTKAQESAEVQKIAAAYKEAVALDLADNGKIDAVTEDDATDPINGYTFYFEVDSYGNVTNVTVVEGADDFEVTYSNGAFSATKK